jgi:hypothetical protein
MARGDGAPTTAPIVSVRLPDSGAEVRVRLAGIRTLAMEGALTGDDGPGVAIYGRLLDGHCPKLIELKLLWAFTLRVCRAGITDPDGLLVLEAGLSFADQAYIRDLVLLQREYALAE